MIAIVGAGKVGSYSAYNILGRRIADVVLVDIAENLARGEALDMMQAAPAIEFDGAITGTKEFSEIAGSELVIVTAGEARRPGMTRIDLARRNAKIVKSVTEEVARYAPDCKLLIVTNPVDIMTYVAHQASGFERGRVFGMGNILDTLRFRSYIAVELGVSREDVRALVIGEHGDSMVPLVNFASVSGIPVATLLSKRQIDKITRLTKTSGADVIKLKASTVYAPAAVVAIMTDAILKNRRRVMSVSTYLEGEYGLSDISIGVPCIVGKHGVEQVLELRLDFEAKQAFEESAALIKNEIAKLRATA